MKVRKAVSSGYSYVPYSACIKLVINGILTMYMLHCECVCECENVVDTLVSSDWSEQSFGKGTLISQQGLEPISSKRQKKRRGLFEI